MQFDGRLLNLQLISGTMQLREEEMAQFGNELAGAGGGKKV